MQLNVKFFLYISPITDEYIPPTAALQQLMTSFSFWVVIGRRGGTSGSATGRKVTDFELVKPGRKPKGRRDTSSQTVRNQSGPERFPTVRRAAGLNLCLRVAGRHITRQ